MTRIQESLLLGTALIAIGLLAVFDIIPATVAQFAPLVVVPLMMRRSGCAACFTGRRA